MQSENAIALGLYFSDWYLTPGIEVYAYTPDKKFVIGAFTELNNIDLRTMATQEIPGDEAILEVFIPDRNQDFDLKLNHVAYVDRGLQVVQNDKSEACEVNVICSEGNNWRDQIRGVAKITMVLSDGTYMCSGSLVNNINQDCAPYFLTADHCSVSGSGVVVSASQLSQWTFRFNYQATTCSGTSSGASNVYTGATYKASDTYGEDQSGSDFFLCRLNNTPPASINPYYNGWSYLTSAPTSGVGIHHPAGDIKKISTYTGINTSYTTHWGIVWIATANGHGVTEGGSSGSPMFDQNKRIVGTLTGGWSACTVNGAGSGTGPDEEDVYGKMSKHWTGIGTSSDKNVKYWLDANNASGGTLAGRNSCVAGLDDVNYVRANIHLYPNPANDYLSIDFSDYNIENGTILVTDILGKTVTAPVSGDFTGSEIIDVRELEPGMYYIMIQSTNTNVSMPFMVQ
ncbi:hypothetical protein SDC9_110110 [bioreactor metagenome]|uniref:Secretion system C-terminal sorting domain-containing protein n=1 Tax=bioreactor metagenome TaxID=1076179 RepID=A0A645BCP0_9ZZZZ